MISPSLILRRFSRGTILASVLLGAVLPAQAQQLEPRAYAPAPVDMNIFGVAGLYSSGDVALDPSVPIENLHARVRVAAPFYVRTFDLLGRQASLAVTAPIADADATGTVQGGDRSIDRTGFGDPALRFAVNLMGSPALAAKEFAARPRETIVGTSLMMLAPLGQYDKAKLINLGTNRWAFKPEIGLSQPLGNFDLEIAFGVWMFTANDEFYGGKVRRQDPLRSSQAHVVYTFLPNCWFSADFTYYAGGVSTVGGQEKNDRQDNTRVGATLAVPVGKQQQVKLSWSKGATVRIGQDFDSVGISWQYWWF